VHRLAALHSQQQPSTRQPVPIFPRGIMGVTKKIVNSNRLLVKNGKLIVVDQAGRKYQRFNRRSVPNKTEIFERQRFKLTVIHAVFINIFIIIVLILTILSK
jgi:hypothetical protein